MFLSLRSKKEFIYSKLMYNPKPSNLVHLKSYELSHPFPACTKLFHKLLNPREIVLAHLVNVYALLVKRLEFTGLHVRPPLWCEKQRPRSNYTTPHPPHSCISILSPNYHSSDKMSVRALIKFYCS